MRRLIGMLPLAALLACNGVASLQGTSSTGGGDGTGDGASGGTGDTTMPPVGDHSLSTADVYARLSPTCVGCHGAAGNRPYFVSQESFETLLVTDRKWIVPGDPAASPLLGLLQGQGQGSYAQMPVGGDSFAVMETKGQTQITMAELTEWISRMPKDTPMTPPGPSDTAPVVQRKSARQIIQAVEDQLGLTDADIDATGFTASSPDALGSNGGYNDEYWIRYEQLGGANWLSGKVSNNAITRSFTQQWVPMSQAFCRASVAKSSALFIDATKSDLSTTGTGLPRIRKNIGTLYLKLLGEPASSADVDALFALYKAKESTSVDDAWANVCAALLRDPLWLTY